MELTSTRRRRVVVDDRPLAAAIGTRIRAARRRAGLTQQALAGSRYTKAYISALETGVAKPSMAALNYLAERLGMPAAAFVSDTETVWTRLDADLRLASGDYADALDAYQDLLDAEPSKSERAAILTGMSEALVRLARGPEAVRPAAEATALLEELGRPAERAVAAFWLAGAHHAADNEDEARALLRGILDGLRGGLTAEPDFTVRVLIALSQVETEAGATETALAYLHEADGLAGELDLRRHATYLHSLAVGYRHAGDHEAAIRAGMRSLTLFRQAEAELEATTIANSLAVAYLETGSIDRAREMAGMARRTLDRLGNEDLLAHLADTEARISLASGDLPSAERQADEAIGRSEQANNLRALLDALVTKARILLRAGREEEAIGLFERAAGLPQTVGSSVRRREVLSAWADTLARLGRHDQAYQIMREALQGGR
jgi:tetratricopeptide (TPR) repeat protein